jgi:hypothetical protein
MLGFNPTDALNYARQISRPRLVGTDEEKIIAQEIAEQLTKLGFSVNFQAFQFSTALDVFLSAEILIGLILILSTMMTSGINIWLTLIQIGLLLFLLGGIRQINNQVQNSSLIVMADDPQSFWSAWCRQLGRQYKTRNIIATLANSSPVPTVPHLYLVAHYDSKSQNMPLVLRISLFVIIIGGSFVFAGLNLLRMAYPGVVTFAVAIGILVIVCGIPLLFLNHGNASPGAIDDASGVGVVLHLAQLIAKQPKLKKKLNVTLLITSAEELGVKGALAYVKEVNSALRNEDGAAGLHVLNFDGIGVDGQLYLVGRRRPFPDSTNNLFDLVRQAADELGFSIGRFSLPGAMFDHIPFAVEGYDAISVIGIGKSTRWIHTAKDSPDKLHLRGFEQAGRLAVRVIEKLSGS